MIGNLNLKFKKCNLEGNSYNENNFKEHEICLIVGVSHEADLALHLNARIHDLIKESNCLILNSNDSIFDLDYTFDEIVEDEDVEDLCLDYDFRDFY